ncbi:MAG: hypothetical protein US57_C0004G0037 [Candidatus Moranbacteria bacterium GW2011_GWC2_37_73]|nr:MAG: hypothetical protein UR95_C0002G0063 [Parcubacteria group bacterium GW2011_GWC1_36_108]KKQ01092.1 MAG: hypothetical protein US09_C0003G0092 [Candidatus Moranbacteria bacterium GW2011_GWD1_36_198]KKQ01332.1 MAG: hypothetical protein US10_C0016G0002 [Candidatus Moranbacteria bacterium GW2011_GWD2_36_198]KKQ40154.1 MAG: hypothetical protein US57_C0004G0037 [Candidatus Moranbacteria bacterium GW2011_GWC2_37_73]HAS00043.1 hypothetical protein [Candidatus Moranbacteria bacterium]
MSNVAIDYERQDALNNARNAQMPNASESHPSDLRVPQKPDNYNDAQYPDNYSQSNTGNNPAKRLDDARKNEDGKDGSIKDVAKTAKNVAGTMAGSPKAAISLAKDSISIGKYINPIADMPFVAAFGAALLKDLLDSVAGPTVILAILFSILCSIFIFMMLLLVSANSKRGMASSFIKKGLILIGGGIVDSIPGINFLPVESLTVAVIYFLTLVERKNSAKE